MGGSCRVGRHRYRRIPAFEAVGGEDFGEAGGGKGKARTESASDQGDEQGGDGEAGAGGCEV